jgi:hypothetical protein
MVLLGWIIVNEADRLKAKMGVREKLLGDELCSVASADNQGNATWIVSSPTAILDSDRSGKQAWQSDRCGRKKRVDEHNREGNTARRNLCGRQEPETDGSRNNSCGGAREKNLLQLPNACVAPETPVHPEIVKDSETQRTSKKNIWQNHPQVVAEPAEVFKPNCECDDGRDNE